MVDLNDMSESDVFQLDPPTVSPEGPVTDIPSSGGGGSASSTTPPGGDAATITLVAELAKTYVFACRVAVGPTVVDMTWGMTRFEHETLYLAANPRVRQCACVCVCVCACACV